MGCMSSKSVQQPEEEAINAKPVPQIVRYFDPIELQFLEIELTTNSQSWPSDCCRYPGFLPSSLAVGYPYQYPDGYLNTSRSFPISSCGNGLGLGIDSEKFTNCGILHGMRRREGELLRTWARVGFVWFRRLSRLFWEGEKGIGNSEDIGIVRIQSWTLQQYYDGGRGGKFWEGTTAITGCCFFICLLGGIFGFLELGWAGRSLFFFFFVCVF